MLQIAEFLPPEPDDGVLWPLMRQAGVTHAVGGLPRATALSAGEHPWDFMPLLRMREMYERNGFHLAVIEDRPPLNLAKRGFAGGEQEIDAVCALIENMGRLGIPVWCYEWMADFNWVRTSTDTPGRGGSLVSRFDLNLLRDAPPTTLGELSEAQLWKTLGHFLERVVPVAERAGVRLAMHPDDPPVSPLRGVGRIMTSIENFDRLLALVPSPVNGITLCQGNFALMTDDLPTAIQHFGAQHKVFFVHMRDVRGTVEAFEETWHDEGPTDLLACLETYRDTGFDGVMRPDHVPTVAGDSNARPGYSPYGRLFAVGYLSGLREAAYRGQVPPPGPPRVRPVGDDGMSWCG